MPDFMIDDTVLPGPKVTWDGTSDEVAVPDMWVRPLDYNELRSAANSLRDWTKPGGGFAPGVYTLATLTVGPNGNITGIAAGTGLTDGDKGDITVSSSGTVFTIDNDAVTAAKIAANSVIAAKILDANVTTPKIADANVTTAKIADNNITLAKIEDAPTMTFLANNTGGTADPIWATVAQALAMLGVGFGQFGTGADGNLNFDGVGAVTGYTGPVANVYTATRSVQAGNITVAAGVTVKQHSVPGPFARGTITGPGKISWDGESSTGQAGGNAASVVGPLPVGAAGGAGGASNTIGQSGGGSNTAPQSFATATAPGGVGNVPPTPPTAGTAGGTCHGGGGGASLANGGAGGNITQATLANGYWELRDAATTGNLPGTGSGPVKMTGPSGGGGGGGGGTVPGGGAGAGGCWGALFGFHFDTVTPVVLSAKGGNGFQPAPTGGVNQPGAGGGAGGGGGLVAIVTADPTLPGSLTNSATVCTGGTGAAGSAGTGTGQAGSAGAAGGNGLVKVYN